MKQKLHHSLVAANSESETWAKPAQWRIWNLDRQIYCKCFNQNIRPTKRPIRPAQACTTLFAAWNGGIEAWNNARNGTRNGSRNAFIIRTITVGQFWAPFKVLTMCLRIQMLTFVWHKFHFMDFLFWRSIFEGTLSSLFKRQDSEIDFELQFRNFS